MLNKAMKKQLLDSDDYYQAKRWEGKPFYYKMKFAIANYPEMVFASAMIILCGSAFSIYNFYYYESSKKYAMKKFRMNYTVVRDDDPDIEKIKKEKERGREFFPTC